MNSLPKLIIVIFFSAVCLTSCGGDKGGSSTPAKADRTDPPPFNIGIDTASLTTQEAVLDANRKIKEAGATFQRATDDHSGNRSDYYAYLKLKGIVSKKTAEFIEKMPGAEKAAFVEKVKAVRD